MNTLIITLGTRDIQLKTEDFTQSNIPSEILEEYSQLKNESKNRSLPARVFGEFLYRYFSIFYNFIDFPIIIPTLELIEQDGITLDNILLIFTDQYEKHEQDTIYFGMVVEKFLKKRYPNVKIYNLPVHDNVISLHDMYDFMLEKLSSTTFKEKIFNTVNLYLHLVGGIDAINNAVRFVILHLYSAGKNLVEVMVDEKTKKSFKIDIKTRFYTVLEYKFARKFVEKNNYSAILELNSIDIRIKTLAEYAHKRMIFQAKDAIKVLENNQKYFLKSEDSFIESLIKDISELEHIEIFMKQLYYNCFIKFQQKDYYDFLMRIFQFIEILQNVEVKKILGIQYTKDNWKKEFEKYLEDKENQRVNKEDLKRYLDDEGLRYLDKNPSTQLTFKLLEYFNKCDKELSNSPEFIMKMNFIKYIEDLKHTRNEVVHGTGSFSENVIFKKLKKNKIKVYQNDKETQEIELLFREFKQIVKIKEDIFEKVNQKIKEYIDENISKARENKFK